MMISPDAFYDMELKGKTPEQIMKVIRSIKREISHLKRALESPDYDMIEHYDPSEKVRISCNRDYLVRAKVALIEAGGEYVPTKAEIKSDTFQERINEIKSISFVRSGFPNCRDVRLAHIELNRVVMYVGESFTDLKGYSLDKGEFLDMLERLYLGEWNSRYVNANILDGLQWEVVVNYVEKADKVVVYGDNAFPYNYDELVELFEQEGEPLEENAIESYLRRIGLSWVTIAEALSDDNCEMTTMLIKMNPNISKEELLRMLKIEDFKR